ncbi:single Ig IL-1-related receptor isoform X3 [Neolamprologus brichardi]|uniref:single Ig IL-1-related receptor isoform X3 n=1 Tax=Neolamprologus brichardi TaxID=32507 RepID=UPI001643CBA9|nr:single Ig IL-1-related receptor isoform X3 [Neolamprologus brichardi]
MAVILVAFTLMCSGLWDRGLLAVGQTCVDESRFKEQAAFVGHPYQLQCPLKIVQSTSQTQLTWQKDCVQLPTNESKIYLDFNSLSLEDQGNYTCKQQSNSTVTFTVRLLVKESQCSKAPEFKPKGGSTTLWENVGSTVKLNCTALLFWDPAEKQCDTTLQWSKDGHPLNNHTLSSLNTSSWSPGANQLMVNSFLVITLRELEDFGLYSCTVRNISADFSLKNLGSPSHTGAVIAAVILLLFLALAAVIYSRCHLNIKLWYKNSYGDYELNDPSAELLMNMSRSRRLIVLLSYAYLEQDWCSSNFRQGLLHLLELCQQPIFIMLDGQYKRMRPEVKQQLSEHQHCLTILTWRHNSVTPSSVFWKELALAMPRSVVFHKESAGDPQTLLEDDKDPMLTLQPDYLDCRSDTDPAGDLGLRLPVYKALSCKAPVLPAATSSAAEPKPSDIDISDLGSRNYAARSDFYCLVAEDI